MNNLSNLHTLLDSSAVIAGLVVALCTRWRPVAIRIGLALLLPMTLTVGWDWLCALFINPVHFTWSSNRLAPVLALARGYSIYQPPSTVGLRVYPPMYALMYLPATLFADPTAAVLAGRCLSLLFYFGPVIWILGGEVRRRGLPWALACLLFTIFAVLTDRTAALRYVATEIHADAPSLGFMAIALGLVGRIRGDRLGAAGYGAIVAAILATWTKQVHAPLVLIPILQMFATGGIRAAARAAVATGILGLLISSSIAVAFGPSEVVFNIWTLPSRHGMSFPTFRENASLVLRAFGMQMQRPWIATVLICLPALIVAHFRRPAGGDPLAGRPNWQFFLLGALFELPLSAMGYAKVGGDYNALAFFLYPLAIALFLMLGRSIEIMPRMSFLLIGLTLYLGVSESRHTSRILETYGYSSTGGDRVPSWIDEQRMVVRYLRDHPGEAYFPCNQLEHLAVDGQYCHFEDDVAFLYLSGFPMTTEQLRGAIPSHAQILCYPADRSFQSFMMKRLLGEFRKPVTIPELPGCTCFERGGPGE